MWPSELCPRGPDVQKDCELFGQKNTLQQFVHGLESSIIAGDAHVRHCGCPGVVVLSGNLNALPADEKEATKALMKVFRCVNQCIMRRERERAR